MLINATSVLYRVLSRGTFQSFAVKVVNLKKRACRPGFSIEVLFICQFSFKNFAQFSMEGRNLCLEIVERAAAGFVYSEHVASHYLRQLLNALNYCHERDIIHRDIRLKCIILANKENSSPVKLGGFHLAVQLPDCNARIQGSKIGSLMYMAPEVVDGEHYNCAVDMWSIGVVAFVLLCGRFPFYGSTEEIFNLISNGRYTTQHRTWNYVSDYAKDFVIKLLTVDRHRRMTAPEALNHPWIQDKGMVAQRIHLTETVTAMQRFNKLEAIKNRILMCVNSPRWTFTTNDDSIDIVDPYYCSDDQNASSKAVGQLYMALDQIISLCDGIESYNVPFYEYTMMDDRLYDILELFDHINLISVRFSSPICTSYQLLEGALQLLSSFEPSDNMLKLLLILNSPIMKIIFHTADVIAYEVFGRLLNLTAESVPSFAHAATSWESNAIDELTLSSSDLSLTPVKRVRIIQFQRNTDEPMGITMKINEDGKCIIARIMHGGMVHRQGTLHVGDEIREINGINTSCQTVENLQRMLRDLRGTLTFKVIPSYRSAPPPCEIYVRAQFDYDPFQDDLIPCPQAGVPFKTGDILQIISKDDHNWWQARFIALFPAFGFNYNAPVQQNQNPLVAGLIPSHELQEWRAACLAVEHAKATFPCISSGRRKKHNFGKSYFKTQSVIDQLDLVTYEEVVRLPSFRRKTLVLLGANGVGRRHIKNTLIQRHPDRFAYPIPHTTRPPRKDECDGQHYYFVNHDVMLADVQRNEYLEYGTHEEFMYGTKLETIRKIHRAGKIAILDVEPQALKVLRTAEYSPFVVFVAAPDLKDLEDVKLLPDGSLERLVRESELLRQAYGHFFDYIFVNNDIDETIKLLELLMEKLHLCSQWVPVSWN
ncbi:peripheral plasma membrane protein CASK [Trichinella spiralis]|uniref:peripheral plasma membrane protein CASK n=1 Tax=Trichinella spiralis TaxID=6334 RepID=UPI0001EFBD0A|nr:peripheral plasma membrane protein CASK [Trichinella spiralis]